MPACTHLQWCPWMCVYFAAVVGFCECVRARMCAHTAPRLARALGLILKARHHMLIGLEEGGEGGGVGGGGYKKGRNTEGKW